MWACVIKTVFFPPNYASRIVLEIEGATAIQPTAKPRLI